MLVNRRSGTRLKIEEMRFEFSATFPWSQFMSADSFSPGATFRHELQALHQQWWCFLLLGISLVVLGSFCIADPLIASIASVYVIGFLMIAGGITQIVSAFWSGKWSGMLLHMLIGVLYAVVG